MRYFSNQLTSALFISVLASCAQTLPPSMNDPLAYSLEKWQELKTANGNDYTYDSTFLSTFGFGSITTFEITDDQVTARSFVGFDETQTTNEEWTERGAEIGSHESGEPARTVEQVYSECGSAILTQDRNVNVVTLQFSNDVLEFCDYYSKTCADDCVIGVSIENLRFVGKPE